MDSRNHTRPQEDTPSATPLNQEPGSAAPRHPPSDPDYTDERSNEDAGNKGPGEMPGYGQGA
jgi:hypothetical protein